MESPACRKYSVSDLLRAVLCDEEIPQRGERDSDAGSAVGDMSGSHDEHFYQMNPTDMSAANCTGMLWENRIDRR